MTRIDRRRFLESGLLATAGGLLLPRGLRAEEPAKDRSYKVVGWLGDDPTVGHAMRDGKHQAKTSPAPSEQHDVVIVGGGLSGLTAAFHLKDMDVVLLEGASEIGGNARATTWRDQRFNIGAAYLVEVDGEQGQLMADCGANMQLVGHPQDRWYYDGKWYPDPWHDESTDAKLPAGFAQALGGLRRAFKEISESPDYPQCDYQQSTPKALELDKITFAEWLKPWAHPDLMRYIDSYCHSAMGGSSKDVSAYCGVNFSVEFVGDVYSAPEGNWRFADALGRGVDKAGAGRIRSGCFVSNLKQAGDKIRVTYHKGGEALAMDARFVILSTPYFVSGMLIDGLSGGQRRALMTHQYAAYVLAGLCFEGLPLLEGFDAWVGGAAPFDDYITNSWTKPAEVRGNETTQVVTCFAPAERHALARWELVERTPDHWAHRMVDGFAQFYPGCVEKLREVHMSRWGHGIIVNRPGMISKWLKTINKRVGRIALAHSDGQGLPAVESCTREALAAARWVKAEWGKKTG